MNQLYPVCLATAVMVALAQLHPNAQARPDFSGSWVLSEGTGPTCGKAMTVSQDATSLSLHANRAVIYKFDGSDTIQTSPPAPPRPSEAAPTAMIANAVERVSRAAWNGDQFVIVSHSRVSMTWPRMMPDAFERLNTLRQILALNANGGLTIDMVSIIDPLPGGTPRRMDLPWSWTCRYTKAASVKH
jgi:hypothetical protein